MIIAVSETWCDYWRQDGVWCEQFCFAGDGNASDECRAVQVFDVPLGATSAWLSLVPNRVDSDGAVECAYVFGTSVPARVDGQQYFDALEVGPAPAPVCPVDAWGVACAAPGDEGVPILIPVPSAWLVPGQQLAVGLTPATLDGTLDPVLMSEGITFGFPNPTTHASELLVAISEPVSSVALIFGLIALVILRRRRGR